MNASFALRSQKNARISPKFDSVEQIMSARHFKTNFNHRIRTSVPNAEGKILVPEPEGYKVQDIMLPPESNMPTYTPELRLTE
jgi:hypothetical protein